MNKQKYNQLILIIYLISSQFDLNKQQQTGGQKRISSKFNSVQNSIHYFNSNLMFGNNCNNNDDDGDRLSELIERSYYQFERSVNNTNSNSKPVYDPCNQYIGKLDDYLPQSPQRDRVKVSTSPSPQSESANKYYRFVPIQSIPLYFGSRWQVKSEQDDGQVDKKEVQMRHEVKVDGKNQEIGRQSWRSIKKERQFLPQLQSKPRDYAHQLFNKPQQLLSNNSVQTNKSHQRPGFIKQQRRQTAQNQSQTYSQNYSQQQQKQLKQTGDIFLYKDNKYQQPTSSSSQSTTTPMQLTTTPMQSTTTPMQSSPMQQLPHLIIPPSPNSSYTQQNKPQLALTLTNHDDNFSHSQDNSIYDINDDNNNTQQSDYPLLLRRQYEQDLFSFIKQQLIRVSVQNRQVMQQFQYDSEQQLVAAKDRNRQLYSLYKQNKTNFTYTKRYQHISLQSLQSQITILQQQLVLSQAQRAKISTSITQKMRKQDQLYFRHKINLQNVILANNQTLACLSKQLESARRREEEQGVMSIEGEEIIEVKGSDSYTIKSLSMMEKENAQLKKQLAHQQQLFNSTFSKFLSMDSGLNHLKLKKQSQLNQLYQQLHYAKQLTASYLNH